MSKVYRWGVLIALVSVMVLPVLAQVDEAPAEEPEVVVVVTAERTAQPASESIASTTVITAKQIKEQGAQTVADVLRLVPGVTIRQSGEIGSKADVSVRGTGSNQVLVMIDGQRVSSPAFSNTDLSKFPIANASRVEVIRGPVSSLYGSEATGGVINIITRKPTGSSGNAAYSFGDNGRVDRSLSLSGVGDGISWQFAGYIPEYSGHRPNSDYSATNISVGVGLPAVDGWEMSLRGEVYQDSLGLPGADANHNGYYDPDDHMWWDRTNVGLSLSKATESGRFEMQAYRIEQELHNRFPGLDWLTGDPVVYDSWITGKAEAVELSYRATRGEHNLVFGGEYRKDRYSDMEAGPYGDSHQRERVSNHALFVQDRWSITSKTDVVMGARLDDHSTAGSKITPRMGINYAAAPDARVRASYAEGFRAPSFVELYYPATYGPGFSGNPDLKPEKSRQYEIGLNLQRRRDVFDLAVFHTAVRDLILASATAPHQNIGRARQRGLELSWAHRLSPSSNLSLSYTYVDATDVTKDKRLLRIPHNHVTVGLSGVVRSWRFGLTGRWTDDRPDLSFDPDTWVSSDVTVPGRAVFDLTLARQGTGRMDPYVTVRNLFNVSYEEVHGYPTEGISIEAGMRTTW